MIRALSLFAALALAFTLTSFKSDSDMNGKKKMLRHAVLFKFKETSSPEAIRQVEDAFRKLPSQIREIRDFEWGINNSPEGLDQGFTHMFFVSFETEKDRDIYLPHPAHKAFVTVLQPHLEKVLVFDYWARP